MTSASTPFLTDKQQSDIDSRLREIGVASRDRGTLLTSYAQPLSRMHDSDLNDMKRLAQVRIEKLETQHKTADWRIFFSKGQRDIADYFLEHPN